MSLRPLAVSVVLAAALLGASVLRDGGAAVLPEGAGPTQGAVPSASTPGAQAPVAGASAGPGAVASPGAAASPGAVASPGATPGAGTGGGTGSGTGAGTRPPIPTPDGPVTAADRFRVWEHGPRTDKLVALTFDDGWNGTTLRQILAILEAKQASATFFPVGRAVERNPRTWREIAAAGFPIGNHSWNHDDLSKGKASRAAADIERATRRIERVTRVELFPAIRPPYGYWDKSFIEGARGAGMQAVIMWDLDTRDWTGRKSKDIVTVALRAKRGTIIVMHTDKKNTVKALPKIIDGLRAKGFRLVTVGQLIGLPGSVPVFEDRALRDAQRGR